MKHETTRNEVVHWIDWSKPALSATVDWLVDRYRVDPLWDMSGVLVVTPGLRSRNRLLELLVDRAEQAQLVLTPPRRVSPQALADYLARPVQPPADSPTQLIAWVRAIRGVPRTKLKPLVEALGADDSLGRCVALARLLRTLHLELGSATLTFADVVTLLQKRQTTRGEIVRWKLLAQLQKSYEAELTLAGCVDPQTARLTAIRERHCRTEHDIVLVGTVDLNRDLREMLTQVADRVHALVFASQEAREGFDPLGCLQSSYWEQAVIPLADDAYCVADRPADQASAAIDVLGSVDSTDMARDVVIGVPDRTILSHVRRALNSVGWKTHDAAGIRFEATSAYRLMEATVNYLRHQEFSYFSRLVRHPDMFEFLSASVGDAGWLVDLDNFQMEFYPERFVLSEKFRDSEATALVTMHGVMQRLLGPLSGPERPLRDWVLPWREFLLLVYRDCDASAAPHRETLAVLRSIVESMQALAALPVEWEEHVSAADFIDIILGEWSQETLAEEAPAEAIELLGWLDLPLDDAPVTIVTGFNEGTVPTSESASLFLPNTLRSELRMSDNAQRYARDAYTLSVLASSPRHLRLICGRRDAAGDPLLPSRLLFATDDSRAAQRADSFFRHAGAPHSRIWLPASATLPDTQQFPIPQPVVEGLAIESLRVTDFKHYLQCPYRFYLSQVLRLEKVDVDVLEMPAYAFGDLVHRVVEAFGRHPLKDSDDAHTIRQFFRKQLDIEFARLGADVSPAVKIQRQQIEQRLDRFAQIQAERRLAGWRIVDVELSDCRADLIVDNRPFAIRGRIDRIDRHDETGQVAVFDYKTMQAGLEPEKVHRAQGNWIDLQLPLYRRLLAGTPYASDGPVVLGYILLPNDLDKIQFAVAQWNDDDLRQADDTAAQVIRLVRQHIFWPPADPPPQYSEAWSSICQDAAGERFPVLVEGKG